MPALLDRLVRRPFQTTISPDNVERFATSWILPPLALSIWRALVSLYAFIVLFIILGIDNSYSAGYSFSYFTVLGYWGLAFYFGVSAAHSAGFWLRGRAWLQSWPAVLRYAHSVFYSTVTVFPFIVTVVFWVALAGNALKSEFSTWSNISEHALNSVFAFSEIVLPRTNPHPWINIVPLIALLAMYLGLAYVSHATEGGYVYPFLDPKYGRGVVAGICIGILVAMIIVFAISHFLIKLRKWLTEKKLGKEGKLKYRHGVVTPYAVDDRDTIQMTSVSPKVRHT